MTLDSITKQEIFLNSDLIEIAISDNCSDDETEKISKEYANSFKGKVIYHKNTTDILDKNFEKSLVIANGIFRKLCNDTMLWRENSLNEIITILNAAKNKKPILFFLNNNKETDSFGTLTTSLSEFLKTVSYFSTWIGGFGIWEEHLEGITDFSRRSDQQLAQVDVLCRLISSGIPALIDNNSYFKVQNIGPKGGYNIAKVFGRNYIEILNEYKDKINVQIFNEEKKRLFLDHIIPFHFSVEHNFYDEKFNEFLSEFEKEEYFLPAIAIAERQRKINLLKKEGINVQEIWRILNEHNQTFILNEYSEIHKVSVGRMTYGTINIQTWQNPDEGLIIGNFVSIANNVEFLLGGNHPYKGFSTYPFKVKYFGKSTEAQTKGQITIGDDVWIGHNATILSGVSIGQGAVIAAKSVITKDVPPYSICGGNPARIIKMRFNENIINKLMKINYSTITDEQFLKCKNYLYEEITNENVDAFVNMLTAN
jgi:acetyltransferase-like isoleucine patch superfamily enzyme